MIIEKQCRRCLAIKNAAEFRDDCRYRDGLSSWCKACHRERNSSWAKENRKRLTAKAATWRELNPETAQQANRKHKRANREELAANHVEWVSANRDKRRVTWAKRRASKIAATPLWANHEAIAAIYKEAVSKHSATGIRLHVDHIIPLQHSLVCGLHCEGNLQILPGPVNESKSNKWSPYSIEEAYRSPDLFIKHAKREKAATVDLFAESTP